MHNKQIYPHTKDNEIKNKKSSYQNFGVGVNLDHAATTPVDKKVFEKMKPYFSDVFGNASSIHSFGKEAGKAVDEARKNVADFFGVESEEIIFTSGATEANNLAIKGIVNAFWTSNVQKRKPHIITTAFEHHCVLNTIKNLEKEGLIQATFINPKRDGVVDVKDIQKAIKANTILVSVMYVNNEIGTVQPIAEIGKIIKKYNIQNTKYKILFHTDATQAINYFDCNIKKLGVDLLSMSAHKIYGPKGAGVLYVKKWLNIAKIQDGGSQERNLRAGTLNVPGIVGLGTAIMEIKNIRQRRISLRLKKLRDYLIKKVLKEIPESKLNGSKEKRSPNNVNFSFKNIEGESLLLMLDAQGIFASTGSACSSGSLAPSHVLLSLGLKPEETHGSLRLTLGKNTTKKEIDYTIKTLKKIVENLRKISSNVLEDYYLKNTN